MNKSGAVVTKRGISSRLAVTLAFTGLSVLTGCSDLQGDDQHAVDDVASQDDAPSEISAQLSPPANSSELSGDNIQIGAVTATGAGCPAGSWNIEKVPEGTAFTLTFNSYVIEAPPTVTPVIKTLACDINLEVRTPKNLSYAVTSFQYFGYANLSAGMKANLVANYAFTGVGVAPTAKEFRHDFPVPYDTTYAVNDDVMARGAAASSAPCDVKSNLQVRTRLTLEQGSSDTPGVLAMDNIDARAQAALRINFQTRTCSVTREPRRPIAAR